MTAAPAAPWANPLRDPRDSRLSPAFDPCALVVIGAGDDLVRDRVLPAVYDLAARGMLPPGFAVVGFDRQNWSDADFGRHLERAARTRARTPYRPEVGARLIAAARFVSGRFEDAESFHVLADTLSDLEATHGVAGHHIFYLAAPPAARATVCHQLLRAGLTTPGPADWPRAVIDGPIEPDPDGGRLEEALRRTFPAQGVFRADLDVGSDTTRRLLTIRFANPLLESVWNAQHIDHLQLTMADDAAPAWSAGSGRALGVAREVVQHQLLHLVALVAMEEPVSFEARQVQAEREKALRGVYLPGSVSQCTARGQYLAGWQGAERVRGYHGQPGVSPDCTAETYAAIKLAVRSRRWAGVPFYLRAGKRMAKRVTEIAVAFRAATSVPFVDTVAARPGLNALVVRIHPDETITLRFGSRIPGAQWRVREVSVDVGDGFGLSGVSTHSDERLLLDVLAGDRSSFADASEAALRRQLVDQVTSFWDGQAGVPAPYPAGSWGPPSADELLAADGRAWRVP